jgi:hypothetical protein
MKLSHLVIVASLALASSATAAEGKQLFETYCAACHGLTGGMDMDKREAPPVAAIRLHYIGPHAEKDDFIRAVADWVATPDESKTLMRGAIKRFKLMPPLPYPRAEVEAIAAYIYAGDLVKPEGFDEHVQQMHGKGGNKGSKPNN